MTTTRVVLADDHPVVRASIRNILNKAPGIEVVGEASNGFEALRLVEELTPDVLLLDMEMPGLKGIEVAQLLQEKRASVHILALSAYDDKEYILGLLASGASGYLIKEDPPQTIVKAVRGVARGEKGWVSRRASIRLTSWSPEAEPEGVGLTAQETEVLRLMVIGKTNKEIGLAMGISEKTVQEHLEVIFTKLNVTTRVEAAVCAVQAGFI